MQAYDDAVKNLKESRCLTNKQKEVLKKANLIYEKGLKHTLGWNIKRITKLGLLDSEPKVLEKLKHILAERNYVIHHLFKDNVRTGKIQKHLPQVLTRLENDLGQMKNMNKALNAILQQIIDQFSNSN